MSALSNLSRFLSPIPCRVRGPEHSCGAAIRGWMASLGACAAFLAVPALAAPNIVVILTDDQDTSTMVAMPKTLERLAAQGTSFSNYMKLSSKQQQATPNHFDARLFAQR